MPSIVRYVFVFLALRPFVVTGIPFHVTLTSEVLFATRRFDMLGVLNVYWVNTALRSSIAEEKISPITTTKEL